MCVRRAEKQKEGRYRSGIYGYNRNTDVCLIHSQTLKAPDEDGNKTHKTVPETVLEIDRNAKKDIGSVIRIHQGVSNG